jgi:hypothetical protein
MFMLLAKQSLLPSLNAVYIVEKQEIQIALSGLTWSGIEQSK